MRDRHSGQMPQGKWAQESAVTVESSVNVQLNSQCKAEPKAPVTPEPSRSIANTRKNVFPTYQQPHPLIRITLCDFITVALHADHGMATASSAFEFQTVSADFSQFQEKCDVSDGSGTGYQFHVQNYPPTPWTGTVVDEVEQCRKGFYNFSHQQIQKPSHSKERESRVRDKNYRGGNGRDRKMRIRSLRGSPVFPSTGLSPPRESSSVPSTNVYVRSPCRSTFSPSRGDYTSPQRDDSGDEDAPLRFLSGCSFEPTRFFTDLCRLEPDSAVQLVSVAGMEAESETGAGTGVGTGVSSTPSVSPAATSPRSPCLDTPAPLLSVALPRSETDTANHLPSDSFAPFNHPSFETYSISNPYTASTSISTSISTSASGSPVRNSKTSLASFSFLPMGACSPTDRYDGNTHSGGMRYKHTTNSQSKSSTSTSTSIKSSPIRGNDTGASIFAATSSHSTFSPKFYCKSDDHFHQKSSAGSTANQLENNLSDIVDGFIKRMDVSLQKVLGVLQDSEIIQNSKLHCPPEDVFGEGSINKECSKSDRILDVVAALLNSVSLHAEVDGTAEMARKNRFRQSKECELNSKEKIVVSAAEEQGRSCLSDTCTPCATPFMDLTKSYFKSFDVDGDGYLTVNDFNEVLEGNVDHHLTDKYGDEEMDLVKIVANDAVRCKEASNGSESNRKRSSPSEMSYVDGKEKEEGDDDEDEGKGKGKGKERDRDEEEDGGEEKSSRLEIIHSSSNSAFCLDLDMTMTPTDVSTKAKATLRSSAASTTDAVTSSHTVPPFHNPYPDIGLLSTDQSLKKVL